MFKSEIHQFSIWLLKIHFVYLYITTKPPNFLPTKMKDFIVFHVNRSSYRVSLVYNNTNVKSYNQVNNLVGK